MRKKPEERFYKKVDKNGADGCWLWTGGKIAGGYGHFRLRDKMIAAHRFAYLHHKGEIPKGMKVCHTCNNTSCVNPEHLYLDTHHGNMKRMKAEGRLAKGSEHGAAKLDEAKVKYIRRLYREGLTMNDIAKMYKVNQVTISKVISGERWSHVTE
jgi:YesN/AraC family two-component response regulator